MKVFETIKGGVEHFSQELEDILMCRSEQLSDLDTPKLYTARKTAALMFRAIRRSAHEATHAHTHAEAKAVIAKATAETQPESAAAGSRADNTESARQRRRACRL